MGYMISYNEPNKKVSELTVGELIELITLIVDNRPIYNYQTGYFTKPIPTTNFEVYCHDGKNLDTMG